MQVNSVILQVKMDQSKPIRKIQGFWFTSQDQRAHCHTHQVYKLMSTNVQACIYVTLGGGSTCLQKDGVKWCWKQAARPVGMPSPPFDVDSPPPLRINLHHAWRSVWSQFIQRWSRSWRGLMMWQCLAPTPSPPIKGPLDLLQKAIHWVQSHLDQDTLGGIGLELSNVVD
jgi:hypothetical protein